jgi:hypothetical protein
MSYSKCVTSLRLGGKIPATALKDAAAEFEAQGMAPDAAMAKAVEEALELSQMEERKIVSTVRAAYEQQGGKKPAPAPKLAAVPKAEPAPAEEDIASRIQTLLYDGQKSILDAQGQLTALMSDIEENMTDAEFAEQSASWQLSVGIPLNAKDTARALKKVNGMPWFHGSQSSGIADLDLMSNGALFAAGGKDAALHYAGDVEENVYQLKASVQRPFFVATSDLTADMENSGELEKLKAQGFDAIVPLDYGDLVLLSKAAFSQRGAALQPAPVTPAADPAPAPAKIEDFGEKLEGARKDQDGKTVIYSTASSATGNDAAVAAMVQDGTSVSKLLEQIAANSDNADHRALAAALGKQGLKTGILFDDAFKAKNFTVADATAENAKGGYRASDNTALLYRAEGAEQTMLHELTHAATIRALQRGGLAATQIKVLHKYVAGLDNFAGEYGISNDEEFIAEAWTNPRFRQMLQDTPAPGAKLSIWQKLVGAVRMLLGMPPTADNVLARVMALQPGLLAENQGDVDPMTGERASTGEARTIEVDGVRRPITNSKGQMLGADFAAQAAFWKWFGDSKAVDAKGHPLVVYHGTSDDIAAFDSNPAYFTDSEETAAEYGAVIMPVYLKISSPHMGMDAWDSRREALTDRKVTALEKAGRDGIIAKDEGTGERHYITFKPEQIKSVTGNAGTFDGANADIRANRAAGPGTAEFKKWFGNSKVVDDAGKPRVVFHGTGAKKFNKFNEGSFFTEDRSGADWYASDRGGEAGQVMEVYLSIQNPLDITTKAGSIQLMEIARSAGVNVNFNEDDSGWTFEAAEISDHSEYDGTNVPDLVYIPKVRAALAAAGFDGIVGEDTLENDDIRMWIALKPEQVKSAVSNNGAFDPANGDIRASIIQAADNSIQSVVADLPKTISNRLKDFRNVGLAALGRRQLVDLYAADFVEAPGKESTLTRYSKLIQQMDADKNESGAEADGIADHWGKLADNTQLADLMHDSTLAQIDPSKSYEPGDNRGEWATLSGRFKALSPEARQLYNEARDAYMTHWNKVRTEIRNRITRALPESPRRAALLEKMDAQFYEKVKGVYFPLARFGDYVVSVVDRNGDRVTVNFAETMNEAEALRKALQVKFPATSGHKVSKVTKKKEFNAGRDAVSRGFLTELFGVLDQYEGSAELVDDINQLYMASLPDLSWAKHGIHRKGTPGFSQDARRAFAQNMFHGARYLAKLRYADRLGDHLMEMQDHVEAQAGNADFDSVRAQQVVDEMNKRHDNYMNPNSSPVSSTLTSLGFIFYLGLSPASAAVNLTQTPLVTLPMLAAKYGMGKASAALLAASRQAAGNRNDISKVLTGDELAAYKQAVDAGVIDVSMAHDLAGIAAGDDNKANAKLRPVMKWASWMFHHGEKFNRQASLMAAYRLARGTGLDHAAAYESAVKDVYDSHFDYSAGNRPRIMQGNVARVVLLFKQYAQNMVYTLSRNAVLAAKGDRLALRTLSGLLVSHALAAGVLGLPVVGTLLAVASALGGDDDEPWDAKVALRNLMADLIGQKPAEVMMHGLSRLGPFDISGRVGLDKLILPDVQEGLEGARAAESWMTAALGPVAGIGMSTAKGLNSMAEGKYLRGLEEMMPVSVRNPIKALRFASEGVRDKTGIPVLDDTSAIEEFGQLIGFSPSRSREAMEGKGAVYRAERQLNDRRAALTAQWAHAKMAADAEGVADAMLAIKAFNEKHKERAISPASLGQSLRMRVKRIAEAEQGLYLPKKHRDVRELGRFAEQD